MSEKPIVCVDLDGVLNLFDGWRGPDHFHPPRPGARDFLEQLKALGYEVVVFTVRWAPSVREWLAAEGLDGLVDDVTNVKPPAHVYVDDRAICFQGDFRSALDHIVSFRAHWEATGAPEGSGHETTK